MHLTNHAYKLFKFLKKEVKNTLWIEVSLHETDMFSMKWRQDIVSDWILSWWKEDILKTWEQFAENHLKSAKLFTKFPWATLKNKQIIIEFLWWKLTNKNPSDQETIEFIEEYYGISSEQAIKIHKFLRTSPNAWLRVALDQTTIYRPFPEIENWYKPIEFKEWQESLLDVVGWDSDIYNSFYKKDKNWNTVRQLTFEQIDEYCEKVISFAKSSEKSVIIPTKSTITKFENDFLNILKNQLDKNNVDYRDCLTDSFLESIAHNKFPSNEYLIASVPNVTISLEKIQNTSNSEIYRESNTATERHFYRGATWDWYAEEKWEENGSLYETNTLQEHVSRKSIEDAYKKAEELWTKLVLVIDDTNNPNNRVAERYAEEITNWHFVLMTLWTYMSLSLKVPRTLGKVFVWSNVIWDYISDFNAWIACSNLKPWTSLGIAPSVDSNGKNREANPAAWTAPMLANKVEESKGILPASILLSVTLAIKDILLENPEMSDIESLIATLEKEIVSTVEEYIAKNESDYSEFTTRTIERTKEAMISTTA